MSKEVIIDFEHVSRGVKREIIIDYDKGEIYVVSPDDATVLINITNRIKESIKVIKEVEFV